MEIEINNTAATNDDYVPVKCLHPAGRHNIPCRIRATRSSAQSSTVVLTNPDGRLRFPGSADTTATVSVPADGSWAAFEISGETGSNALNDAVIQAHCQTATGPVVATKPVTVFWFDQAQINITSGGNYGLAGGRYAVSGGNAVNYSAQARIRPPGVNCSAPQITNLRIGIIQNNLAASHTVTWGNPVIAWNAGVAAGTTVTTPNSIRRTRRLPAGVFNDSEASVAPLYDQPGKAQTLDPNSLASPIGCAGGGAATSIDSPSPSIPPPLPVPATTSAGVAVGTVTYSFVNTTMVDSFRVWTVVFDTVTNDLCTLRQRTWDLNVDSAAAGPQHATVAPADSAPNVAPVTAVPFGVPVINDPANQAISQSGTITFTK